MQCFISSEPLTAKAQGVDTKVFLIADTGFNPYTTVVVTKASTIKEDKAKCEQFVQALREGWQAYLKDPQPTNEVMAKLNPSMDLKTFNAAAAAEKPLRSKTTRRPEGTGLGVQHDQKAGWKELTRSAP